MNNVRRLSHSLVASKRERWSASGRQPSEAMTKPMLENAHDVCNDQPPPGDEFIQNYLPYLLARASSRMSAQFHERVKNAGYSVPFWRVMGAIPPEGGLSVSDLVNRTMLGQPTLTKIIMRMEDAGLIHKQISAQDARRTEIALTDFGRQEVDRLIKAAKRHEKKVLMDMDEGSVEDLKEAVRFLIARLEPEI